MIYYLDTSAWAKRYFAEKGSAYISQIWLANERFACSGIGLVEIIAATFTFGRKEIITSGLFLTINFRSVKNLQT